MNLNRPDFFDVLPYHPPPEPFESVTGYLVRLAQINGIKSAKAMGAICFPDRRPSQKPFPRIRDYPPRSWGALPVVTTCCESELLATTFYYLVQKFGRSVIDKTMGQFLKDCLSDSLRYCPLCLREAAYYRLPWRFLTLSGCPEHGCRFLDRCGHCGQPIPFLIKPLVVGICPHCRGDLSHCQTASLPEQAQQIALDHLQDLQFLLAPEPSPLTGTEIARSIGLRLVYWRLEKRLLGIDVARQIGVRGTAVHAMEGRNHSGAYFLRYVQYAAHLGVTLRQVFNTTLPPEVNDDNWREWSVSVPWREQTWVSRVRAAIKQLETEGKPVRQKEICEILRTNPWTLRRFPQVRAILEQIKINRNAQQQQSYPEEAELRARVQVAIGQLQVEGNPVSQRAICLMLGLKPSISDQPFRVKAVIKQETLFFRQQRLQQRQKLLESEPINPADSELVTSVQQAIESLKQSDRSVTIEAIRQIVHRSDVTLRANPHVDLILEQVIINQHLARQRQSIQREEELVQAIQAAVTQLEAQDKSISQQAIAQIVGLSLSALNEYPRIKELLKNLSQQRAVFQQKRRRQREQQLVTQVQTAIRELELLNQPLSLGNIARQVGRSLTSLQCYPQVKEILEQVKVDYQQARIAQAQERDKELAKATRQAAETLTQLGQPITKRAISQLVGLSLPSYRSYPRAIEVLNQVVQQ